MVLRRFIFWLSSKPAVTGLIARRGMRHGFARRFVPGETLDEAIKASRMLNGKGRLVSLNQLGEYVTTRAEAESARDAYLAILNSLRHQSVAGNISIKLSQLGLKLDTDLCLQLADSIAGRAATAGGAIEVDMEGSSDTEATLHIYETIQRRHRNATLAIQAYLHRSSHDLEHLASVEPAIRLVKGAYREPADIAYQGKREVDRSYCRLLDQLFGGPFRAAIATQDPAMIDYAKRAIQDRKIAKERYEFQMMYGIRRDLQEQLVREGHPLRIYVPFGTHWCPYFMRRISERPANALFVLRSLLAESSGSSAPGKSRPGSD